MLDSCFKKRNLALGGVAGVKGVYVCCRLLRGMNVHSRFVQSNIAVGGVPGAYVRMCCFIV